MPSNKECGQKQITKDSTTDPKALFFNFRTFSWSTKSHGPTNNDVARLFQDPSGLKSPFSQEKTRIVENVLSIGASEHSMNQDATQITGLGGPTNMWIGSIRWQSGENTTIFPPKLG
jgi:hypothetical protein